LNGEYAIMCSFAEGDLSKNIQHHYLHDAVILRVNSSSVRWGLVGIKFSNVTIGKT
jgi:lipopolysaccharide transport system ATP-binding protein